MSRLLILKVDPATNVIFCYCRIALELKRVTVGTIEGEPLNEGFFLSYDGEGELDEETGIIRVQTARVNKSERSDYVFLSGTHRTPRIRAWIGFSRNPDHITYDKRTAWADWYGLLDVSGFRDRFGTNFVHNVEIVVKQDLIDNRESWKQPFTMKDLRKSFSDTSGGELLDFLLRLERFEEQEMRRRESEQIIVPIVEEEVFQDAPDFDSEYQSAASDLPQAPLETLSLTSSERSRRSSSATARLGQSSETAGSSPLVSPSTSLPPPGIPADMWAPHLRPDENPSQSAVPTTSSSLDPPSGPREEEDFPVEIRTIETTPQRTSAWTDESHLGRRPSPQPAYSETPQDNESSDSGSSEDSSYSESISSKPPKLNKKSNDDEFAELRSRFQPSDDDNNRQEGREGSVTSRHEDDNHFGSTQPPHRQDDCQRSVRSRPSSRSTQQPRPQDYQYECDPSRYEVNPSRSQSKAQGYFHNDNSRQYDNRQGRQNEYQRKPSKRYDDEEEQETSYARADQQSSGRAGNGNQESRMSSYHNERFSGSAQQNRQDNRQRSPEPFRHDMDREPIYSSPQGYQQNSYQSDNRQGSSMSQSYRDPNQYRSESRQQGSSDQHRFRNGTPRDSEFVSCYHYNVEAVPLIHEGNRIVVWLPDYKQAAAIWRTHSDFSRIRLGESFLCKMNSMKEEYGISWHIAQISDFPSNVRYSLDLFDRKANGYEALAMRHNVDLYSEIEDFWAWYRDNWDPILSTRDGVVVVMGTPVRDNEGEFGNPWKALDYYRGHVENRWFFSKCHLDYRQIPREVVDRQYRGTEIVRRYVWVLHEIEGLEQVISYKEERARERNYGRYQ